VSDGSIERGLDAELVRFQAARHGADTTDRKTGTVGGAALKLTVAFGHLGLKTFSVAWPGTVEGG